MSSPEVSLPAFDGTLGALFIGSTLSILLYGVICLQMFIYITAPRTRRDSRWLKLFVLFVFLADTTHGAMMVAAMYRFLVTDFANPLALPSGGPGSAEVFTYAQSISGACTIVLIQLFFSWRIWALSGVMLSRPVSKTVSMLTVVLALFSFGCSIDLAVEGFNHRLLTTNTSGFVLAYKLSASSRIAFDVFITVAMTWSLQHSRSGFKRTDHVITTLIFFTVNTNLLTTLLSIAELVTFLTLPNATVYGGIGFLSPKTYFNTLLASLNSREYISSGLQADISLDTDSGFHNSGNTRVRGVLFAPFSGTSKDHSDRLDGSLTAIDHAQDSRAGNGSYESTPHAL